MVIHIDRGFGRNVKAGKDAAVQFAFDGTDSNTAMIIMGYANTIVSKFQSDLMEREIAASGWEKPLPNVDLRDRAWFNGNLISRNY